MLIDGCEERNANRFSNINSKRDLKMKIISCRAKYFIAAPNLLRVGVEETVSVSVFDVDGVVDVQLELQDYPNGRKTFSRVSGKFEKRMCFLPGNFL